MLAGVFLVAGLSLIALPGLNGFVSEFLVMVGSFETYKWATGIAAVAVILAGIYLLMAYKHIFTGPKPERRPVADLDLREKTVAGVLIAIMLALGFYPKPALDLLRPAVSATLQQVGVHDPAPSHGAIQDGSTK